MFFFRPWFCRALSSPVKLRRVQALQWRIALSSPFDTKDTAAGATAAKPGPGHQALLRVGKTMALTPYALFAIPSQRFVEVWLWLGFKCRVCCPAAFDLKP